MAGSRHPQKKAAKMSRMMGMASITTLLARKAESWGIGMGTEERDWTSCSMQSTLSMSEDTEVADFIAENSCRALSGHCSSKDAAIATVCRWENTILRAAVSTLTPPELLLSALSTRRHTPAKTIMMITAARPATVASFAHGLHWCAPQRV
jgi:hypothetical protein